MSTDVKKAARVGGLRCLLSNLYCLTSTVCAYWFSRFQLMRSPSVVEEEDEELDWLFVLVSL